MEHTPQKNSKKAIVISLILFIILIGLTSLVSLALKRSNNVTNVKSFEDAVKENEAKILNSTQEKLNPLTPYEKCLQLVKDKNYVAAYNHLKEISKNDSNYSQALTLKKKIKHLADEEDKRDKQTEKEDKQKEDKIWAPKLSLQNKYETILKRCYYMYEAKDKLHSLNFQEVDKGYAPAQDGSNQLQFTYQKKENDYTVHVILQYSYASSFYYSVLVYDSANN